MFNLNKLDIRGWVLGSFILMICLIIMQVYINDSFEQENQLSREQAYKEGTELQLKIKDLRIAFSQQMTLMKDLLLQDKDGELYHTQLGQYYASERHTFETMEQTFFLLKSDYQGKLLTIKINNEYRNLVKYYRKGIRAFNASDEQAHVFSERILKDSEKPFITLLTALNKLAVKSQYEKTLQLNVGAEKRHFYSWVLITIISISFILFLYIVLGRKIKELRNTEISYQHAEQDTNNGLWDWNILTDENYFSTRFIELLGYSPEDEFPRTMEKFSSKLHPDDIDDVMKAVNQHLEKHKTYNIEYRLQMKDGTYKWFLDCGQAIWDEEGKPVRMTGSVSDISSLKQADEQLRRINYQLHTSIDNMPNAYILWDKDLKVIEWNKAAEEIFGYSKQEMLGKNPVNYIVPESVRHLAEDALRKLEIGKVADYSEKNNNIRKDGESISCQWFNTPLTDNNGNVFAILTLAQDITARLNTEESLRSQARIIDQIHDSVISTDLEGVITSWNKGAERLLGYTSEEMIDEHITSLYPEEEHVFLQNEIIAPLQEKGEHEAEARMRRKSGEDFYAHISLSLTRDENDNVNGMIGYSTDITARKIAETALVSASVLNESIIKESPIGLAIYSDTGQCIATNQSIAEMIGATQKQMLKQNYNTIASWEKSGLLAAVRKAVSNDVKERLEIDVKTSFGKDVYFDFRIIPFQTKGKTHLLLMADDITERKQAEEALLESELWMRNIYNSLDEAVLVVNSSRELININNAAVNIFGYSEQEIFNSSTELFHVNHEHYVEFGKRIQQNFSEDQSANFEFEAKRKNGEIFSTEHTVTQLKDSEGKLKGMVSVVRDISGRKAIEFELDKHRNKLEELVEERTKELRDTQDELVRKERLATLGQLTATVSHELRNPLGAMRPSLFVIEKKSDKEDERLQQAIQRIDRNIDRCDHIIDELLNFTRISKLDLEPIQIDKWLKTVIEEQVIPEGINIEKEFGLKNIEIFIDMDRFRRAMINVIENACHSMMDDNQKIVKNNNSYLKIKTIANNDNVEIKITDNGSGIKESNLDKIFEPLFSTKSFGVGLGMSAIKQIMQQHGGGIEIESEETKGTTVTLWLPLNQSEKH